MPDDMYNQILDGENIISDKEAREMELASIKSDRMQLYNRLISYYVADTTGLLTDSLYLFLNDEPSSDAKYMLASLQLQERDTLSSGNTLDLIPQMFLFSEPEQDLHDDYTEWFAILKQMIYDTIHGFSTDSAQIERLTALMLNGKEPVKFNALSLLANNGIISYTEPYLTTDEFKKGKTRREVKNKKPTDMISLNPNPCSNYVTISYNLSNIDTKNLILEFTTIEGVSLHKYYLVNSQDVLTIPIKGLICGLYLVTIRSDNNILVRQKLVVVK